MTFPQWLVDFCTFSGAVWWGLVVLSLAAFLVLAAVGAVQNLVRGRRAMSVDAARVIEAAERFTKEAVQ